MKTPQWLSNMFEDNLVFLLPQSFTSTIPWMRYVPKFKNESILNIAPQVIVVDELMALSYIQQVNQKGTLVEKMIGDCDFLSIPINESGDPVHVFMMVKTHAISVFILIVNPLSVQIQRRFKQVVGGPIYSAYEMHRPFTVFYLSDAERNTRMKNVKNLSDDIHLITPMYYTIKLQNIKNLNVPFQAQNDGFGIQYEGFYSLLFSPQSISPPPPPPQEIKEIIMDENLEDNTYMELETSFMKNFTLINFQILKDLSLINSETTKLSLKDLSENVEEEDFKFE